MSKKTFSGGLNSLLGEKVEANLTAVKKQPGRPKTQFKEVTKSTQQGTKEGETRATFIVREDLLEKVKEIAYWDRILFKDVVNKALEAEVARYEKKNGPLKPVPKK